MIEKLKRLLTKPLWIGPGVRTIDYLTGRCPEGMPKAAWKCAHNPAGLYWIVVVGIPLATFVLAWLLFSGSRVPAAVHGKLTILLLFPLMMTLTCLSMLVPYVRNRRYQRRIQRLNYEVCLECGYVLTGLPDVHRCPECGAQYDKSAIRRAWVAWIETGRAPDHA